MVRLRAAIVSFSVASALVACSSGPGAGLFTQYEYEEETYLSLDGAATVYVNSSIPALNALRGSQFDTSPGATIDRAAITAFFERAGDETRREESRASAAPPRVRVTRVTFSHRNSRLYIHVRLSVDDVRQLEQAAPFAWSTYDLGQQGNLMVYRQRVRNPAEGASQATTAAAHWTGSELVAFRMHIPSKVAYHNAGADNLRRGNILVWEQPLRDRLAGRPVEIEARMETQSILYRTLWLFLGTIGAVALMFAVIVWWIAKGGARARVAPQHHASR
jgi:hypothetical protein